MSTPFLKECFKSRESNNCSGFNCLTAEEKILDRLQSLSQYNFIDGIKEFLDRLLSTVEEIVQNKKWKFKVWYFRGGRLCISNPLETLRIHC